MSRVEGKKSRVQKPPARAIDPMSRVDREKARVSGKKSRVEEFPTRAIDRMSRALEGKARVMGAWARGIGPKARARRCGTGVFRGL